MLKNKISINNKQKILKNNYIYEYGNGYISFNLTADIDIINYFEQKHPWLKEGKSLNSKFNSKLIITKELSKNISTNFKKFGRNLFISEKEIIWFYQDWFKIKIFFDRDILDIKIEIKEVSLSSLTLLLKCIFRRKTLQELKAERLLYAARMNLHFPLFFFMKTRSFLQILHASAVLHKGKAFIFLGFDGIGKSTLALKMKQKYNSDIICDNFCPIDTKGRVYPFIDGMRIENNIKESINVKTFGKIFGRNEVFLEEKDFDINGYPISCLFLINRGVKSYIKSIKKEIIYKFIRSMDGLLPEMLDYKNFESLLNIIERIDIVQYDLKKIRFLKSVPTFQITTDTLENLDNLVDKINEY